MSRFFKGDSDSESEQSDNSDLEETAKQPSRFNRAGDSSSDDEVAAPKRFVKSTREKRLEELNNISKTIKNYLKEENWNSISPELEKLNKSLQRASDFVEKEGVPRVYLRTLVAIEDAINKGLGAGKEDGKKAQATKQLNVLKQKIKKNNTQYEKQIKDYRENPDLEEDEDEGDDDIFGANDDLSETEEPVKEKPKAKHSFFKTTAGGSDDEDEDEDEEDEEDEDEEREEDNRASKWLRKEDVKEKDVGKKKPKEKGPREKKKSKKEFGDEAPSKESKGDLTSEQVDKKLAELLSLRGKKGTDRLDQIEQLEFLASHARADDKVAAILVHLVSAQFDLNLSVATHMPAAMWKSCLANLQRILTILNRNPSLAAAENEDNEKDRTEEGVFATGNLLAFVDRLDDEFTKGLQNIEDQNTAEYKQRLEDEQGFIDLAAGVLAYYERLRNLKRVARAASRILEHIYYKKERDVRPLSKNDKSTPLRDVIHRLATLIYANGDDRLRARAMLMHIYHHAFHDRFFEARDMMLMSHLQENVHQMDVSTQMLFNRTMIQLGLCAFRSNLIVEAHSCLAEVCGGGRVKELLGQGIANTRFTEKNAEQEKIEKKRLMPQHMHLNLELLECVHLISAMLLEVPNIAANPFDPKKKIISRTFRRYMDIYDRQIFNGPPENNRDVVVAAAKALSSGNWKGCETLLLSLKVWALFDNSDNIKANLRRKIKEEGLCTYLFTYSHIYDSLSLKDLASMFELEPNTVHSLVSKMMISEELHASWDQPTGSIIMHHVEPSKLQYLAMQFAEKVSTFVDNNERFLDTRTGGYGYNKYDSKSQQKERGQWQEGSNWQQHQNAPRQQYQQYRGRQGGRHQQQQQGQFQTAGGKRYDRNEHHHRNK